MTENLQPVFAKILLEDKGGGYRVCRVRVLFHSPHQRQLCGGEVIDDPKLTRVLYEFEGEQKATLIEVPDLAVEHLVASVLDVCSEIYAQELDFSEISRERLYTQQFYVREGVFKNVPDHAFEPG